MGASAGTGRPLVVFWSLAAAALALDQLTKALAGRALHPSAAIPLLPWLQLALNHNTGSAFGLIPGGWVLVAVGFGVCFAILGYVSLGRGLTRHPGYAAGLGLVLGGSAGNLLDRLRTKGVVDFIDLGFWPVFNIADVAITVGFAVVAIQLLRAR